jgi:hypothetical protein
MNSRHTADSKNNLKESNDEIKAYGFRGFVSFSGFGIRDLRPAATEPYHSGAGLTAGTI